MHFNFNNLQVRAMLGHNNNKLYIPRFQRDYSWEIKEVSEFVNDILLGIELKDNKVECSEYFFGTILLAGDINESNKTIEVIDGQQRITTMTIFLSSLAKSFYAIEERKLGDLVWNYIMKENDDGELSKVLENSTANHYFEYLIQMKKECSLESIDEEQDRMKEAYDYCNEILKEGKIKEQLIKLHNNDDFNNIPYIDILKGIRTQLLSSNIICISTKDKKSSNTIFEILNAKGKQLDSIDLIKNKIFKYLDSIEPTDEANNIWNRIKSNLTSRDVRIEFQTFFRHYWISKYKKVKDDQLYNEFIKEIQPEEYEKFLMDVEKAAELYMKIVCPYTKDYDNRKELLFIPECLSYFNNYFKIKQIRVALLALLNARNEDRIKNKKFKEILIYLHGFHFAYNSLCKKRSNMLELKYSKFAIQLNAAESKEDANKIIDELKKTLDEIFPNYNEFEEEFIKLEFSKGKNKSNMLSKYVLNNLEKYYSGESISKQDGSVEHILSEDKNAKYSLSIGNLILLEEKINNEINNQEFKEKRVKYGESKYSYVSQFVTDYDDLHEFTKELIEERAKKMAEDYYTNVLGRNVVSKVGVK
ncbi:hypothetical protein COF62_19905 [Bacillus toyonensis]|uniref:DUF262 domain-containing protein n=2 Tax=Bacillus toyonensis TaxID=155322 RepID=A0AAP8F105_9BACI|nr:DUF262 domain-containing protein [Bacillus toyonensis]PEB90730.1 hypothetical protein CON81_23345 [Bacillus toyonensis]PHE10059.1 hypothetical protein COF62_19905 [Bacillus toyonensis]